MTITETLADSPALLVALALVMRAGLAWQRSLTWPEYRLLHGGKRLLFPVLQRRAPLGFDSFVNAKGGRDDAEYLRTYQASVRDTVSRLTAAGGSLHLLNSIKRRPGEHGDPLTAAHVVWDHGTDQTEAYLFANADGTTDVYAHFEPSPEMPLEHLGGGQQQDGDPRGVVTAALDPKS
jgi:hypothetical protein